MFLDGSHVKYHANAGAEPVLGAWGKDTDGKPVFVGPEAGESGDAWAGFVTGFGERGLACPLLAISDKATGLIGAVERPRPSAPVHDHRYTPPLPCGVPVGLRCVNQPVLSAEIADHTSSGRLTAEVPRPTGTGEVAVGGHTYTHLNETPPT